MAFTIYSELCNHHHTIQEHFHYLKRNPSPLPSLLPFPPTLVPSMLRNKNVSFIRRQKAMKKTLSVSSAYALESEGLAPHSLPATLTGLGCFSVTLAFLYSSCPDKWDDCSGEELPRRPISSSIGSINTVFFETLKNLLFVSINPAP